MLVVYKTLYHAFFVGAAFMDQGLRNQVLAKPAEGVLWPNDGVRGEEGWKDSNANLTSRMLVMPVRR